MPESARPRLQSPERFVRRSVVESHTYRVPAYEGITVKLNQNECPFDIPEGHKQIIAERFLSEPWHRYPDEFGSSLRAAIADSVGWDPDGVLLGNGSNELAQYLGFTLIEQGANVALLDPMFSLFAKIVALHEGTAVPVGCASDFSTDPGDVIGAARDANAALTILATPNNPTGRAIAYTDLEQIADASPGLVLVDEAYHEFVDEPPAPNLLHDHPNVLVMRTLSKTVGLAGLRLGYVLADPGLVHELLKARLPFMVNRLTAVAAEYLLENPEIVDERAAILRSERDKLFEELDELDDVDVVPSSTNFLIFKTPLSSGDLERRLADAGVLVRDVSGYPVLAGYVRVNAGRRPENKAFLSALKAVLSST